MEKITDKIAALPKDGNYFSLEFFPPKTQMVPNSQGMSPSLGALMLTQQSLGFLKSSGSPGTHVPRSPPPFRNSHMGCRWQHQLEVPRTCRDMPAAIRSHNMPTLDMYEYEAEADR